MAHSKRMFGTLDALPKKGGRTIIALQKRKYAPTKGQPWPALTYRKTCTVYGCEKRPHVGYGKCEQHYGR